MIHPHLFGPVKSRRLGISLGVDLIPLKTCTLDCIYCECGATTNLAIERKNYVSSDQIINELENYLSNKPILDYITFAGSGEPTLNTALTDIILFLKKSFPMYKTALLTNGTLFHIDSVVEAALQFDLVAPSIDAVTEGTFKKINRPHPDLSLKEMINSLILFSTKYQGTLLIEVFIIPGINDTTEELELFKATFERMKFTKIQLNSLDRPGTDGSLIAAPIERLQEIAQLFFPLPVEIISRSAIVTDRPKLEKVQAEEMLISILRRRPSTAEDLACVTALSVKDILKITLDLESKGSIKRTTISNQIYFLLA